MLIEDHMLFGYGYLNGNGVQKFLEKMNSWLKDVKLSGGLTFSTVLDTLCKQYFFEPLFFLAMAQKEQSAVERLTPPSQRAQDWLYGWGKMETKTIQANAGLERQLIGAIKQHVSYGKPKWNSIVHWQTAKIKLYDSTATLTQYGSPFVVIAQSRAEAMAYLYNPRVEGVANLSRIWKKYFEICRGMGILKHKDGEII